MNIFADQFIINMIVVDCERMKYPNTGLFAFCDNLSRCLVDLSSRERVDMEFFVPSNIEGRWGNGVKYRTVHDIYKLWLPCTSDVKVWHTTQNTSPYCPPARVKRVLTMHDLNFLYELPLSKHARYMRKFQDSIDRADTIVAISRSTKRDIEENLNLSGKSIEVIYNGLNFFDGEIVPPQVKPDGKFIFTVGTILRKKNFHVLPRILKGNDYRLVIAGNISSNSYCAEILEQARKWGVESRVTITGPVSEPVKQWYLQNCDAFVFPSIAEGFGLPVIEAMRYGKPIFLSDHTSLPEIGGDKAFYFDHFFDPDAMRARFEEGMKIYADGGVDADAMRAYAESFSWENTSRLYMDIYKELL